MSVFSLRRRWYPTRWLVLSWLLLAGCAGVPVTSPPSATVSTRVSTRITPLPGSLAYRIDPRSSELRVLVYRAGALARFGHNHVLVNQQLRGTIYWRPKPAQTRFVVSVPVAAFIVDKAAARAAEGDGFARQPDAAAIAGTRTNLLGAKVLDAARYPQVTIRSVTATGPAWQPDVTVAITLRGVTRSVALPVAVVRRGARLTVVGAFTLKQSDFGMAPFSALGGALSVRDAIKIRFRLAAIAVNPRAAGKTATGVGQ